MRNLRSREWIGMIWRDRRLLRIEEDLEKMKRKMLMLVRAVERRGLDAREKQSQNIIVFGVLSFF
jgi:hypothetical protein